MKRVAWIAWRFWEFVGSWSVNEVNRVQRTVPHQVLKVFNLSDVSLVGRIEIT